MADKATCVANRQQVCVAEMPGRSRYNAAAAEACIAQVGGAYADAKITKAESQGTVTACAPVFDGAGIKNSTCSDDQDCMISIGLRCVQAPNSAQGTCQTPQVVQGGGSCSAVDAQCAPGFHCGTSAHCDVNAALHETCDASMPCAVDLTCSSAGTCVEKTPDGATCMSDAVCANGICNRASATATGICVTQITLAPTEPFCVDAR